MFKTKSDFLKALQKLPQPNQEFVQRAEARQLTLTKPEGSLGRLEDLAAWLAGWQMTDTPHADRVSVTIFAGNHGIMAHKVSPYPADVTLQMVENFKTGGAAINQICKSFNLGLSVKPIDLDQPTGDVTCVNAMSEQDCLTALNIGAASIKPNDDIIVPGEMGIGNSTIASILCAKVLGGTGIEWAGCGTGLDEQGILHKAEIIDLVLSHHNTKINDPFSLLCQLGGREIAAICGLIVAARLHSIPVILDGFIVSAAASVLTLENKTILDHCVAGHVSNEQAHKKLLKQLNLFPALLDLNMRLGEATGSALAVQILRGAVSVHNGMASFDEAGITHREK